MKIATAFKNGKLTIGLQGELDHHSAKTTLRQIDRLLEEYLPRDCVMDLSALSFMDSSGIALILQVYKRMHETGGRIWVENAGGQPLRVIDTSGIERMVRISIATGGRILK